MQILGIRAGVGVKKISSRQKMEVGSINLLMPK